MKHTVVLYPPVATCRPYEGRLYEQFGMSWSIDTVYYGDSYNNYLKLEPIDVKECMGLLFKQVSLLVEELVGDIEIKVAE